jgi:hypothetical protein
MKYKLIFSFSIDEFERYVDNALSTGWIFHGTTFVEDRTYYQAMCKYND